MPNLKSAKKKARQDVKRKARNRNYSKQIDDIMNDMKTGKNAKADIVAKAYSVIDKAAKKKIIHKNKADRMKRRVSKLTPKK
jgi:small subunit ribosomal protein S20